MHVCRFCQPCRDADAKRVITLKPPPRKSARKHTQRDYAGLQNTGVEQDPNRSVTRHLILRLYSQLCTDGCE